MSEMRTVLLVGASGLLGTQVLEEALGRTDMRVIALGRREFPLPLGGRSQLVLCEPSRWGEAIADIAPDAMACALGAPVHLASRNAEEFRSVDLDLVVATARAAREANVPQWIQVSAAGANRLLPDDPYLQIKGEADEALIKMRFQRLDILRPGTLRGRRRSGGGLSGLARPVIDLLRKGARPQAGSIEAREVARGILQLAREKAPGRFIHDNEAIHRAARRLPALEDEDS